MCYRFEGTAPHTVALYLPVNFLKLRVAVLTRPVRRKEHDIVLYVTGLLTNIHLSIMVHSMLLWCDNS